MGRTIRQADRKPAETPRADHDDLQKTTDTHSSGQDAEQEEDQPQGVEFFLEHVQQKVS